VATAEELKETKATQPMVFFIIFGYFGKTLEDFKPEMVAGHSVNFRH
jgi:hypothetical protein